MTNATPGLVHWTRSMAEQEVARLDPTLDPSDDRFKSAVLLLASLIVGPQSVGKFTGYDVRFIAPRSKRLRANGIWKHNRVHHSGWFHEELGGIAFWLDVSIAEGLIARAPSWAVPA